MKIFLATARLLAVLLLAWAALLGQSVSQAAVRAPEDVVQDWYKLILELVRHTPNYSPPVASRSFAYIGVTIYEVTAGSSKDMVSLAGQLNDLTPSPKREAGKVYDEAIALNAAMNFAALHFFDRTGPTGQRSLANLGKKMHIKVSEGVPEDVETRSVTYGQAVAEHILAWSQGDGGAVVENMGFPRDYKLIAGPAHWVPTSKIAQQQVPLLPNWGKNRPFAMPSGSTCPLPAPPTYSEDKASDFYKQAKEVYDTVNALTPEQKTIARFWSDDPMLSQTPPGHWLSITLDVLKARKSGIEETADALMRVGVTVADGFIGCWDAKMQWDLVRPVTYIKRLMDPKWEPLLITPPFPEYPSGHSTQSGAAAVVLAHLFGETYAFDDHAHEDDGLPVMHYASFQAAAEQAAISRLYGGIHFRAAIERGLTQGECIGAYAVKLKTRVVQ
jgi:hypothetical protein